MLHSDDDGRSPGEVAAIPRNAALTFDCSVRAAARVPMARSPSKRVSAY